MKGLKTIKRKSPKLKAIQTTNLNVLAVIVYFQQKGLIHRSYRLEDYVLFFGRERLRQLHLGDWIIAHPDKSLSIVDQDDINDYYFLSDT